MKHPWMLKAILGLLMLTEVSTVLYSQPVWKDVQSVEDVCIAYPNQMNGLLSALDLEHKGLEKVKESYEKSDLTSACHELLAHYRNGNTATHLRMELPAVSNRRLSYADSVLKDIYTFQRVSGQVPRLEAGQLKWDHNGPEDDIEWAWALNRHYPVASLLSAYHETGNPEYARHIDGFIKDWIVHSWPYPDTKSSTAMWRGLEVSFREKVWSKVFYTFLNSDYISPATQLLILSALPDHAHYARNFHGTTNWLTMEMTGLATVATAWPEFKQSKEWLDYTLARMTETLKEQVYPDGAQTELTTHYHRVALSNFYLYYTICSQAGIALPDYFTEQIESMWHYLAYIMRPDGNALLNNDSDLDYNRDRILDVAREYNRQDWLYIASNGKEGIKPEGNPSVLFPWAGHMVSRSGFGDQAHWSFFDVGPWGSGHQHNDKLHLSVSAFGKDFLVDAGRFAYRGAVAEKFRGYARGSQGHNVVLIDGNGQESGPTLADEPIPGSRFKITKAFDFANASFGNFKNLSGKNVHSRSVFYVRDGFWVVVDKIQTDEPRDIETLWHWHPQCEVTVIKDGAVMGSHDGGKLQIIPVGGTKQQLRTVKGQETPEIQGWYSERYNQYEPNTVSIYSNQVNGGHTNVWLLLPSGSDVRKVRVKLLSTDSSGVKLEVTDKTKGSWTIAIPYLESDQASLVFKPK